MVRACDLGRGDEPHTAVVYRGDEDPHAMHIELLGDRELGAGRFNDADGVCVRLTLTDDEPETLAQVIQLARVLGERLREVERSIPFGRRYLGGVFEGVDYRPGDPDENGLSCATFVIALLKSANLELLARETWPEQASPNAILFHPFEVAGACLFSPPNVPYVEASSGAAFIHAQVYPHAR